MHEYDEIILNKDNPAVKYLCSKDKRLAKVIDMIGEISYKPHDDGYAFIIHEIIEQMLSIKAGAVIYSRLQVLCDNNICPEKIAGLTDKQIKSIGTANSKVSYIKGVTEAVLNENLVLSDLQNLSDDEVIKKLTSLRGIGLWTAKMYLIFVLNRQNVLPVEDVAFLQSYKWLYKTDDTSKDSVMKKCKKWSPYSSIAARYLYRALDTGLTKNEFHLYK